MPLRIKEISVFDLRAPLNQPFRTALGQHNSLENLAISIKLSDGSQGFGEAAIATHITGETIAQTKESLLSAKKILIERQASQYDWISRDLHTAMAQNKSALAAIETALLDALTRSKRIPLWKFFGPKSRKLRTDITIVIADLNETKTTVRKYYKRGFRSFKVKIGKDPDLDFKRVLAVRQLAPRGKIILDANQGYTADQTLDFLSKLKDKRVPVQLIEQPVKREDWEGLKKVSRLSVVPVCADESCRSLDDARKIIKERAATVINIKLMKTGLIEGRAIALLAQKAGLKLMIGGMMETSLAMTASAHLAAGLGGFDFIDLDTPFFIKKGFDRNPFLSSDGVYDLSKVKEGIGIVK